MCSKKKVMAYPSPTTTHLIACILFRSASLVLLTLTETLWKQVSEAQSSVRRQEAAAHLPHSPPFTLPLFFIPQSLFLILCTIFSFCLYCVNLKKKSFQTTDLGVKVSIKVMNEVERRCTVARQKGSEMSMEDFKRGRCANNNTELYL